MVGGPKVIIVSVHVLYISLYRYDCLEKVFRWVGGPKVIIVSVCVLYISLYRYDSLEKVFRWVGGPKVIIVSVRVLYISLYRYACVGKVFRWVVGGWSQSDYSVCPHPLHQFIQVCLCRKSFPWVVPK